MCIHLRKTAEKMSRGQSQRRSDSQSRALERCKAKGKSNDVIDVDSDKIRNFINIDSPESSQQTFPGTKISGKDKTPPSTNIIWIDDDESGDNNPDSNFTSRKKFQPAPRKVGTSVEVDGEEYQVVQGRKTSSKSSKCQGTYFAPSTSHVNDDSDCFIVEDYSGSIREQWERASLRKKTFENVPKGQSGAEDQVRASGFSTNCERDVKTDKMYNQTAEPHVLSSSTKATNGKDNLGSSMFTGEDVLGDSPHKSDKENQYADLEHINQPEICHKTSVCNTQGVNELALKSMSNTQPLVEKIPVLLVSSGGPPDVQNYIIGEREMLKKTDAYKRADEEEWASRQRELQIQAKQAQQLLKRKKAENARLLDMERRQKQRLEEVREAQKKDEETLNLKEQLRVEVRRELDKLEAECTDMASLLRGLGIHVGGGLNPLSFEVRAAYKQAQLRFHPDRASGNDIRRAVEAEEKFKLISRAKETYADMKK